MKKNKAVRNKKEEKEYKKKRFFARDDEYEDDEEVENDEDDDAEDDDEEDDGNEVEEDEDDDDAEDDDDEDDDDNEDDDEDDDEEEEIEDDGAEWGSDDAKRARRRARRIRNQILAYLLVVIVIGGAIGGCFWGGRKIVQKFQSDKQAKELEEQLAELQGSGDITAVNLEEEGAGETQEEVSALSPLDEIVTARIAEMPIEDKVAALFMVTPSQLTGVQGVTKAGDKTKEALAKYKVGGLVYTDSNITGADQLKELLSNTALIDQTLFLAVSEEGGKNNVVGAKISSVPKVSDMASIGESGGADGAYQAGSNTGTYLAEYGFNLNLAPVADVKTSEGSILGNRSFGTDAGAVGEMAASYIKGLTEKGVSACVKMFPGLGGVTESTENGMADTQRSQSDMESAEFLAYQAAIAAGSEFVMVGTMSAPILNGDNTPCCLKAETIGLLRDNLGFDGVIITGALNETAVTDYYTSAEAVEKAVKAGVDMIYMPEKFEEAYNGLLQAVQNGTLEESRIDESLLRIYRVKYKDKVDNVLGTEDTPAAE